MKFVENFGSNGFIDKFLGTCEKFDKSVYFLRHKVIFSFKSAQELYPSDTIKKSE